MLSKLSVSSSSKALPVLSLNRSLHVSRGCNGVGKSQLFSLPEMQGSRALRDSLIGSTCRDSPQVPLVQGLQGREQQFESHNRRLSAANVGNVEQSQGVQGEFRDFKKFRMPHFGTGSQAPGAMDSRKVVNTTCGKDYVDAYNMGSTVSLHGTMQTNVPTPFVASERGLPSHLNMPAGGVRLRSKYTSGEQMDTHYTLNRKFHSLTSQLDDASGTPDMRGLTTTAVKQSEAAQIYPPPVEEDPAVQGVQGDGMTCIQFKTWLSNCQRFNIDCADDIRNLTSGRKALADIFDEQTRLIRQISADYRRVTATSKGTIDSSKVSLPHDGDHSFIQGTQQYDAEYSIETLLTLESPCPQGVQGHMCSRFKLWLHNCAKYGFNDCSEQLKSLQSGRKSLNDIFDEQDRMITAIAKFYNEKAGKETVVVPEQFQEENLPDCSELREWLENCRRYGLSCDGQLKAVQSGELSLAQVFSDQRETIQRIGKERRVTTDIDELPPLSGPVTIIPDTLDGLTVEQMLSMSAPCPESLVDTPDAQRFHMWLDNCRRYGLAADDVLDQVQNRTMTLHEMMDEQDASINEIAEQYLGQLADGPESLVGLTLPDLYRLDNPCPQGIQGDDCEHFKLWLENCAKYGSTSECEAQLQDFQSGRKTIQEIFREQQQQIKDHAQNTQSRSYSTDTRSKLLSNTSHDFKSTRSYSTPPTDSPPESQQSKPTQSAAQLTRAQKLKLAVRDYGTTVIVFHVGISLLSLGGFYTAVSSGIDMVGVLERLGVGESILSTNITSGATTFIVAYAVHKVFAPVRIAITLSCTPVIVRRLRTMGILKTPAPK